MYANRHARPGRLNPGSLATSLAITGAMIAGLIFSAPQIAHRPGVIPFRITNIPLPVPPPPEPPKPQPRTEATPQRQPLPVPKPQVPLPTRSDLTGIELPPLPPAPPITIDPGPVSLPTSAPTAEPALVDPAVDARYADQLQPAYPPDERRAGHEARITVRVLVGMDGRVKRIEPVGSAPDSFLASTRRQALTRWRFRPGTRGGIPVEAWRTMTVRFVMGADA